MRASTVISAAFSLALFSTEVLATPPACLLACVAQVGGKSTKCSSLNQVNCFCTNEGDAIKSCLDSICPDGDSDAAYSAFKSSCSEQNAQVNESSKSSSASSTSASSSSASSSAASSSATSSSAAVSSAVSSEHSSVASSSSTEVSSSSAAQASSSSSSSEVNSQVSSSEAPSTTKASASSTLAVASSSSSSVVSHPAISTISEGAGNLLQSSNSFMIAAVAALLF